MSGRPEILYPLFAGSEVLAGIGPKTAQKLIAKFGSIENLLENTSELKGKQKERVEENKDQAIL